MLMFTSNNPNRLYARSSVRVASLLDAQDILCATENLSNADLFRRADSSILVVAAMRFLSECLVPIAFQLQSKNAPCSGAMSCVRHYRSAILRIRAGRS